MPTLRLEQKWLKNKKCSHYGNDIISIKGKVSRATSKVTGKIWTPFTVKSVSRVFFELIVLPLTGCEKRAAYGHNVTGP